MSPAMVKPWDANGEIRALFADPRPVDVQITGQWCWFERARLVAVDLRSRVVTFEQWERLDWRTDPYGHTTRITTREFHLDKIRWRRHEWRKQ